LHEGAADVEAFDPVEDLSRVEKSTQGALLVRMAPAKAPGWATRSSREMFDPFESPRSQGLWMPRWPSKAHPSSARIWGV